MDSSVENVENYTKEIPKMCKIPHFPHFDEIFSPLGVPLDLKSSVKNVLTFLWFAVLQSASLCLHLSFSFVVGVGIANPPVLIGRTFFTADFKSAGTPSGGLSCLRLAVVVLAMPNENVFLQIIYHPLRFRPWCIAKKSFVCY